MSWLKVGLIVVQNLPAICSAVKNVAGLVADIYEQTKESEGKPKAKGKAKEVAKAIKKARETKNAKDLEKLFSDKSKSSRSKLQRKRHKSTRRPT